MFWYLCWTNICESTRCWGTLVVLPTKNCNKSHSRYRRSMTLQFVVLKCADFEKKSKNEWDLANEAGRVKSFYLRKSKVRHKKIYICIDFTYLITYFYQHFSFSKPSINPKYSYQTRDIRIDDKSKMICSREAQFLTASFFEMS